MHIRELVMGPGCIFSCPRGNVLFCRYILSASLSAFLLFFFSLGGETEHSCTFFFLFHFFGTLYFCHYFSFVDGIACFLSPTHLSLMYIGRDT